MARDLDWTIVKPSLVIARGVYGGTALVRGLAGLPLLTPIMESPACFRPIHIRDLCRTMEKLLAPDAPIHVVIEVAGPQESSLQDLVATHRRWLGFGPARFWIAPKWLTTVAFVIGDMLGAVGMRTALRSTSRAQMARDVGGDPGALQQHLGFVAQAYERALNEEPASVQDRWHARLYFVKPAAQLLLAAFWMVTGIVCLTTGRNEAMTLARNAGLGSLDGITTILGGLFDIVIGVALLVFARFKRSILFLMAAVTIMYMAVLTYTLPYLWADPLGRLLKLIPFSALLAFLAAVEDER